MGPFSHEFNEAFSQKTMPPEFGSLIVELAKFLVRVYVKNFDVEVANAKATLIAENFSEAMKDVWHVKKSYRQSARNYFLDAACIADAFCRENHHSSTANGGGNDVTERKRRSSCLPEWW